MPATRQRRNWSGGASVRWREAPARLRPRSVEADGKGETRVRSTGPQASLALPPGTAADGLGRSDPRAAGDRCGVRLRSGLIREDGTPLYTFTSVADDADTGITHIIRGEDHVTNTAVQIQIFEALGAKAPVFAHHNLLVGAQGEALSKRLGSLSIQGLREQGFEPLAVMAHASLIGTSEALQPQESLEALAHLFHFSKISRAPARFDPEELKGLNAKLLHAHAVRCGCGAPRARCIEGGEAFWLAVRANLEIFADVDRWWAVVRGPVTPVIEDAAFLDKALAHLPSEPWDASTWRRWTEAVKQATGAKGRALYHPLRLALTGLDRGPELKDLLPLIGHEKAGARLSGKTG